MCTAAAAIIFTQIDTDSGRPSMPRPRRTTVVPAPFTLIPFPAPASTPPRNGRQSIVIDLVMVTAPKPPLSIQLMMPPIAVLEMAPAKVLQGAVRLHGLTSSPTPETQVRVACA